MLLLDVQLIGVGPFASQRLVFADDAGTPRPFSVLHGAAGVGKTSILGAVAATRPGHAVPLRAGPPLLIAAGEAEAERESLAISRWWLGLDEPDRPHGLLVTSPNVRLEGEPGTLQRREQLLHEKLAQAGGYAFTLLTASRSFARQPLSLTSPLRTIARHDPRASVPVEEGGRQELTREVKQALAYAELSAALTGRGVEAALRYELLAAAMRWAVDELLELVGVKYLGCEPGSLEPVFRTPHGRTCSLEGLPVGARHLVGFAALPVRTLWAAYPGTDPRLAEGVVLIDDLELHQDAATQSELPGALQRALPRVQWIVASASALIAGAAAEAEVLALRRDPERGEVELHRGAAARTH